MTTLESNNKITTMSPACSSHVQTKVERVRARQEPKRKNSTAGVAAEAQIRDATRADLDEIQNIYNFYVVNSTATFDTNVRTKAASSQWWVDHQRADLPVLVVEFEGRIIAWGSLSCYNSRCAYRSSVEASGYVHPDFHRLGLGKKLLVRLVSAARQRRYHCLVGLICSENEASLNLVYSLGFKRIGELQEVGRKFDRWLNVTIVQKVLNI